jgi:branched-chain amino acid transport system substrate-binding protein
MRLKRTTMAIALGAALLVPAAATGELPADGPLTVVSSMPLQGASRDQTVALVRGERLALAQAAGTAGGRTLRLRSLDDSTRRVGNWDAAAVARNARRAAADDATVGYIGEFNSGATKISMPILNRAGIAQVSPSTSYVGLTQQSERGEPGVYSPSGTRTFARITPADNLQGAAIAAWMRIEKVKRIAIVHDGDLYGRQMAAFVTRSGKRAGIEVAVTINTRGPRGVAAAKRRLRTVKADALFYGGVTANGATEIFRGAHSAHRGWRLYGGDGVCEWGFTRRLGAAAGSTRCTVSTLGLSAYPGGKAFGKAYRAKYHGVTPDPWAIYGYESMRLLLDAINRAAAAGPLTRAGVVTALMHTPLHDSPIGPYAIDARGDTTSRLYGGYVVRGGGPHFSRALDSTGL